MPKGVMQEKFQRTVKDPKNDGENQWKTFESQRRVFDHDERRYTTSPEKVRAAVGGLPSELTDFSAPNTNMLPPGMFIDNQQPNVGKQVKDGGLAGSTDVSNSVDAAMLSKGYQRQNMSMTEELYTNEHTEEFYGEATVDGKTGFLERNNYLDRN